VEHALPIEAGPHLAKIAKFGSKSSELPTNYLKL
jgi:hypothetical protein